ncbi:MAG: permease prefix domain 1-containing protein [Candidatus Hydrogenedentales bacterium]|jgi:hypothetical protein
MKALRVHVERIVRPIRASVPRKNKMREELLGHLMTAFAEESRAGVPEEQAVACAAQRLGDPGALRSDLQSSVPALERMAHLPIPISAPELDDYAGVPPVRFAARFTAAVLSLLVIGSPVLVAVGLTIYHTVGRTVLRPRPFSLHAMLSAIPCVAAMVLMLGVALFVALLLFDAIGGRRMVSRSSETPAVVKACLTMSLWVVAIGLFLAMAIPLGEYMNRGGTQLAPSDLLAHIWKPLAWVWLALPAGCVLFMTPAMAFERRQYEDWGSLDIDSNNDPAPPTQSA